MNDTNKIIFRRGDYRSDDEFFDSLFKQIRLLVESNHVLSFHENPNVKGVYALQFNPSYEFNVDSTYPVWLTSDEILYVSAYARKNLYEDAKQTIEEFEDDDDFDMNLNGGGNNPDA